MIKENNWRNDPIDRRILPLVRAMNATGVISTIASCEGHFSRVSDPYVYFSCSPVVAECLARRLDEQRRNGTLHHYWRLTGEFDTEHKLGFTLRAEALSHGRGLLRTFWNYVIQRWRIDQDLAVLEKAWGNLAEDEIEFAGLKHPVSGRQDNDQHEECEPLLPATIPSIAASRVGRFAIGTGAIGIGGDGRSADVACDETRHSGISLKGRGDSNLSVVSTREKRPSGAVTAFLKAIKQEVG